MEQQHIADLLNLTGQFNDCPLIFKKDGDALNSFREVRLSVQNEEVSVSQDINILNDGSVYSACYIFSSDLNGKIASELSSQLSEKYGFVFDYDDQDASIWAAMPEDSSWMDDMPIGKRKDYISHIILRPIKLIRIFYLSYKLADEKGIAVSDAIAEAEAEAEEHGYEFEYPYNNAKDIVDSKGPRYYIEHSAFPSYFYSYSDDVIEMLTDEDENSASYFLGQLANLDDLSSEIDFSDVKREVIRNEDGFSCIRIRMPKVVCEPDCTDIILVKSGDDCFYYTIEAGAISGGTPDIYFVCGWDYSDDNVRHCNFGNFKKRDQAVKHCLELVEKHRKA